MWISLTGLMSCDGANAQAAPMAKEEEEEVRSLLRPGLRSKCESPKAQGEG